MKILLTNDDSHRSPLFRLTIEMLRSFGDLCIVVPHHEQSWTGKSMSRFGTISVHDIDLFGHSAFAVTGTPADCVNIGIHTLLSSEPDLVVSGINAGLNCGIGFLLSSGTVGAAIEANLSGVPSIAISQAFDSATLSKYGVDYSIEDELIARLNDQYAKALVPVVRLAIEKLLAARTARKCTVNVNMPYQLGDRWRVLLTEIDHTTYGNVFQEIEVKGEQSGTGMRHLQHSVKKVIKEGVEAGDIATITRGDVSVTPLNPWSIGRRDPSANEGWKTLLTSLEKGVESLSAGRPPNSAL